MGEIELIVHFGGNDQSILNLAERLADSIRLWCLERGVDASVTVTDPTQIIDEVNNETV